jgi:ATP-binding protein involved in chromosome partitioning
MEQTTEREKIEQDRRLKNNLSNIKYKIIIMSGKGGVGKTTVAVNLAYALSLANKRVGILDIDIHGPNVAKMLGIEKSRVGGSVFGIEPTTVLPNLKAISIALLLENQDKPIIWRGPLKMGIIKQFLSDVHWGSLDYLIVDSPPGTGDEPLSAIQLINDINGAVIVTTPQDMAILDARKSIQFAKELNIPVIGIIENMSGFICPHCHNEVNIFKKGGGKSSANDFKVPFLGSIAFEPEFVELADKGTPFVSFKKELESAKSFNRIVDRIEESIGGKD